MGIHRRHCRLHSNVVNGLELIVARLHGARDFENHSELPPNTDCVKSSGTNNSNLSSTNNAYHTTNQSMLDLPYWCQVECV